MVDNQGFDDLTEAFSGNDLLKLVQRQPYCGDR